MGKTFRTEGVVLRGIRYGEADRVLHIYTEERGKVSAMAKGVRRTSSRFGGRLEPFFRLNLMLHEGRGDLFKVTGAQTLAAHIRLRESRAALDAASQGCEAILRLMGADEPNRAAYNLLCRYLALLEERARCASGSGLAEAGGKLERGPEEAAQWPALALAFRLKLLWAAGFAPQLAPCASCGSGDAPVAFSAAAGGAVCAGGRCRAGAFDLNAAALAFMRATLETPMADLEPVGYEALRQTDRAIVETLAYHAQVRLRPVVSKAAFVQGLKPGKPVAGLDPDGSTAQSTAAVK